MAPYNISKKTNQMSKYVNFEVNGRLFPSWIMANFKKYQLPEIIKSDEDPCNPSGKSTSSSKKISYRLKKYQAFLGQYMNFESPYKDILIYHGLGSGKTASAINIYNALYNYTPGWNVFILLKASLRDNWVGELDRWLQEDEQKHRMDNVIFIHYDSPYADKNFLDAIKKVDNSKKSMYIIEEVHNFIRNVYGNISSSGGKRAQVIYDYIIQDKRDNYDTRVVLLSGTPAVNKPFEFGLLFNLLRPGIFPKSENKFNHMFVTDAAYETLNDMNKNLFQRRIMGLVSYYIGGTSNLFASKTINYINVPMSNYHQEVYTYYEEIEAKIERESFLRGGEASQIYKSYTRQACNFVFPTLSQRVTGEQRPRPNKFKISDLEVQQLAEGVVLKKGKEGESTLNVSQYDAAIKNYLTQFTLHLTEADNKDTQSGHNILNDYETYLTEYHGNYNEFYESTTKKSNLFKAMTKSSNKFMNIIFNILKSRGKVMVFSNFVMMEGLEIFKIYLKFFGFYNFMKGFKVREGKIGYVEFHGGIKKISDRYKGVNAYNEKNNNDGSTIKIILLSPAAAEGISLTNVLQVNLVEPYWNEVRLQQAIGRAIRLCSHKDMPVDQRHVEVFRYKSVRNSHSTIKKPTTDEIIEGLARKKDNLIQSFLSAMKEAAVDCNLNKNHNQISQDYKCFQFDENSLLEDNVGRAYHKDIDLDKRYDNGLNAPNSMVKRIKVMKIKAVMQLSDPSQGGKAKYSKVRKYWYYSDSGVVYDYDMHYAIGKILIDDNNIPTKLDDNTYIIGHVIPIPLIR